MIELRTEATVDARIHVALPNLNKSDRKVAEAILEAGSLLVTWSISDLAHAAGTGNSTVSRACRSLGFDSYQALKFAAAKDAAIGENLNTPSEPSDDIIDSAGDVLRRIAELHVRSIRSITATLDEGAFSDAVEALRNASRIILVGAGTSAAPALDAAHRFVTIGLDASAPTELNRRILISRTTSRDVVIALSYSGSSQETLRLAQMARDTGATVIAITCFAGSPLTDIATLNLVAGGPELSFRLEALSSRIAHLTVLDALYVAIALQDPEHATAALDGMARATSDLFL